MKTADLVGVLPRNWERAFGYDGDARYLAFYWASLGDVRQPQQVVDVHIDSQSDARQRDRSHVGPLPCLQPPDVPRRHLGHPLHVVGRQTSSFAHGPQPCSVESWFFAFHAFLQNWS